MTIEYTEAEPVRQHVLLLNEAGITVNRISELAGLSSNWIVQNYLAGYNRRGRKRRTRTDIAAKILAIDPETALPGMVNPTGTRRRIQALVAAGWPLAHIATQAGIAPQNMTVILARPRLRSVTVTAFAGAYDVMARKNPLRNGVTRQASNRARNRAASANWPPPRYWARFPGAINDPHFTPEYGLTKPQRLAEEAVWMVTVAGVPRTEAATRLGLTFGEVDEALARDDMRKAA